MSAYKEININLGPWNAEARKLELPEELRGLTPDPSLTYTPPINDVDARYYSVGTEGHGLQTLRLRSDGRIFAIHFGVASSQIDCTQANNYTRKFTQSALSGANEAYGVFNATWDDDTNLVSIVFTHHYTTPPDRYTLTDSGQLVIGKMIQDIWRRCGSTPLDLASL